MIIIYHKSLKKQRRKIFVINTKHPPKDTLVPGSIFLIIYCVWAMLVSSSSSLIHSFDNAFIELIYNNNASLISFAKTFTKLGNTSTILVETIIITIVLLVFKQYAYALFVAGTMAASNGYNWIIKHVVQRARPSAKHLVFADGYSFPSGHSVGSATLFGILIILTILLIKNSNLKALLIVIWALFPLIIGYTRIYLHVHFPSDVFGGWIEGVTFVLLGYSVLYHLYIQKKKI